ncbi:MAG: sulfatase [Acidobacteria bacterium]|nr:sulfatase [Acidobacteriota bacterium]
MAVNAFRTFPHRSPTRGMRRILPVLFSAVLLTGAAAGATDHTPGPVLSPGPRNVLLITLDTTRADHLSCYGSPVLTSPNIDGLARQGVRFSRATAVIPLTGPGHATILTGLYPRDHGAIRNGVPMVREVPTLATILSSRGYRTAAFVSGWTLRRTLAGLDRGFDTFDDDMTDRYHMVNDQRMGDQTADHAIAWLKEHASEPFFLWIHLFDPHEPYTDHGLLLPANPTGLGDPPSREILRRYNQEIAFADLQVGRVLRALSTSDAAQETMIILTSDHGEAFGENGEKGHGRSLYQATQDVPFILVHPSLGQNRVSDLPVSTLDVTPTVLDLLDLLPITDSDGVALGQALQAPGSFAGRAIYQETFPGARKKFWRIFGPRLTGDPTLVAIRRGDWKAIFDPRRDRIEIYDLGSDPREQHDLSKEQTVRAARFRPLLAAHAERDWLPPSTETALSDADRERLESLGYVD